MTADASQDRPALPEHEEEIRAALRGVGIDETGTSRDGGGNSRISREHVDSSALAAAIAATGISDDPIPRAVPRSAGSDVYKGTDLAEKFAAWQKAQKERSEEQAQLRKAQDALGALRGDVDRRARKKEAKRRRREAIRKSPALRESDAWRRSLKTARRHLVAGVDNETALGLGHLKYKEAGGKLTYGGWKQSLLRDRR